METWFLYVVLTAQGTLYTGVTKSVRNRVAQHNAGRGAKYLRGARLPCTLLMSWAFDGNDAMGKALRAEAWLKKQPRQKKVLYALHKTPLPHVLGYIFAAREHIPSSAYEALGVDK